MLSFSRPTTLLRHAALATFFLIAASPLFSQDLTVLDRGVPSAAATAQRPLIVIGFAGGFIKRTDMIHGEVSLAAELRKKYGTAMDAEVFENHHGNDAHKEILRLLSAPDGTLPEARKKAARIVLYGHSWGASETVDVARMLQQDGIPVLLLVQVDGVPKHTLDDGVIPANVAQAINYYQLDGVLHGRREIRAANPQATEILGNIRVTYKKTPVKCPGYPWYTKLLTRPHIEIENDPQVWGAVESRIASELTPGALQTARLTQ